MRRLIFPAAAVLALVLAAPAGAQSSLKIGYINSQEIIQEAPGAQQARQQLEQQLTEYRQEVQQMGEELQDQIERYEQQQMTLSEEARQQRQEEIRQKQQEYQQRVQQLEDQAARRQQEVVAPIMQQINTVIEDIRREGSYTVIFDVAAQGIVAADPGLDLTAEVIRRLKEQGATPGG